MNRGVEINYRLVPKKAIDQMSKDQQSYIDEFKFYVNDLEIHAWYADKLLAIWDGEVWKKP